MQKSKKEKLLFMGCSTGTLEALMYSKKLGIYTIMTDYYSPEKNILKKLCDEYWMIDIYDIEALDQKCRIEKITGIFAATSEFCLDITKRLCNRLNLPFYASEEGWACARNKLRFKKRCIQYGLKVPKYFQLEEPFNKKKLSEIIYPVIVKPTDSCAQQGLSLCWNEKELSIGYHRAMEKSPSKQVLIEEYIFGNEIDIFYFIDNGKPLLISMNDKYFMLINNRRNASFQPSPSQFYGEYSEKLSFKVKKLFEGLNCKQGNIFLQAIYKDGEFYFLEMGYRIDGIGTWVNTKSQIGFSNVELMVDLALGRKLSVNIEKEIDLRPELQNNAIYLLWAKPGKVGQVIGLDEIKNMEGVNIILERFHKGDFILKTDSMLQIAYYIGITGKNQQDVLDKLKIINEKLHLYSVEGKELLTPFLNYNVLQKRCNR